MCLSVCLCLSLCLSVSVCLCLSVCLSVSLSLCLSVCLSVCLSLSILFRLCIMNNEVEDELSWDSNIGIVNKTRYGYYCYPRYVRVYCVYMYVGCMYVHVCMYMYVCTCMYVHTCTYVSML